MKNFIIKSVTTFLYALAGYLLLLIPIAFLVGFFGALYGLI